MTSGKGKVVLIGAGPGDPELITLKAIRFLSTADIIFYDYLVHSNLLGYAKPGAQLVCVGKRKGYHSKSQDEINDMISAATVDFSLVVRLKGGDPFLFGRGGEELAFLSAQNISVEVVPGISAGMAVPAYAGIPLTFRELSRSVAFVSGALAQGESPSEAELPFADTIVVFMAITHLAKIVGIYQDRLGADTPAALIYRGTVSKQKVVVGTLKTIETLKDQAAMTPPTLLVIGQVAKLAESLSWRQWLPLNGQRVVLLRAVHQVNELTNLLQEEGAEVVQIPLLKFLKNAENLNRITAAYLTEFTDLIATSPNGVHHFMQQLFEIGEDARSLAHLTVLAIGPKTADTFRQYGVVPNLLPRQFHSEGILAAYPAQLNGRRFLIPTAEQAGSELVDGLTARGGTVDQIKLYSTSAPEQVIPQILPEDVVVFTSPSSVQHFNRFFADSFPHINCVSIGAKTTAELKQFSPRVLVESVQPIAAKVVAAIKAL